jgi:hypothetical protein
LEESHIKEQSPKIVSKTELQAKGLKISVLEARTREQRLPQFFLEEGDEVGRRTKWVGSCGPHKASWRVQGVGTPCCLVSNRCTLIRLQCIYNFLLFHAIIVSIFDVLYAIIYHFWDKPINLVPSASCCFLLVFGFSGNQYQAESKRRKNFGLFFYGPEETLEGTGEDLKSHEGVTRSGGAPEGARPLGLWAPHGTSWPNSASINSQIFP